MLAATAVAAAAHGQASPAGYLHRFDRNGDGRVSVAEYVAYMSGGFLAMDRNHDGALSRDELPGGRGHPITLKNFQANLRRQFHKLDRNHDGTLSLRELIQPPQ